LVYGQFENYNKYCLYKKMDNLLRKMAVSTPVSALDKAVTQLGFLARADFSVFQKRRRF